MEASAIPASVGLARTRIAIGAPLLRIRSDEQLVSAFRSGNEDAFRVIHDRYRQRMLAYARQMLAGSSADPEDAVQEIFVRAYAGLRASDRQLALRAWLYRIAHNRCIDELRRPQPVVSDAIDTIAHSPTGDPVARVEQRDVLRRLIADVQRLPEQQRSALLMRELGGVTYADMSGALGVSVPAVKSLLVRARVGLAQASEARDAACAEIRQDVILSHDRGVRTSGLARRHMRDCPSCRQFRTEVRGVSRQLAGLAPTLGPLGVVAKLLGIGGAGGSVAGGGGGAATATAATGASAGAAAGALASGAGHVATIVAAAVVTAGGAIELQHITPPVAHHTRHHLRASVPRPAAPAGLGAHVATPLQTTVSGVTGSAAPVSIVSPPASGAVSAPASAGAARRHAPRSTGPAPLTTIVDPNQLPYSTGSGAAGSGAAPTAPGTTTPVGSTVGTAAPTTTPTATTPPVPGTTTPTTPPSTIAGGGAIPAPPVSSTPPAGAGTSGSTTGAGSGSSPAPSSSASSTVIATPAPTASSTPSSSSATPVSGTTVVSGSAVPATSSTPGGSVMPRRLKIPGHHRHGTVAVFTTAAG